MGILEVIVGCFVFFVVVSSFEKVQQNFKAQEVAHINYIKNSNQNNSVYLNYISTKVKDLWVSLYVYQNQFLKTEHKDYSVQFKDKLKLFLELAL